MKFNCSQENLYLGVSIVQKAVSNKNTMPILSCIYLEATKDNKLILRTTDLEIGIEHILPIQTIEPGKTILPAKYFIEIVRHLPNTDINISLINEAILITYEKSRLTINTYAEDEFPNLPIIENIGNFTLNANIFKKNIKQVSIATSSDNNRPIFTGILLEFSNNGSLNLVATDTHRLAFKSEKIKPAEINTNDKISIIVPSKVLVEISRLLDSESMITLIIGKNNQVVFKFDSTAIYSRLIQGQFPNYKQVIPNNFKSEIKVKNKEFLDSLERAALLNREEDSKKRTNNIKISFTNNILTIDSYAPEVGNIHEELQIQLIGEQLDISFNARYLLDVLKVIDDEFISFKFTGSLSPAIIEPNANENFLYLILPVRSN